MLSQPRIRCWQNVTFHRPSPARLTTLLLSALRSDTAQLLPALRALVKCVVASRLPESGWYTAAEAAIAAIYALHPSPQARHRAGVALQTAIIRRRRLSAIALPDRTAIALPDRTWGFKLWLSRPEITSMLCKLDHEMVLICTLP